KARSPRATPTSSPRRPATARVRRRRAPTRSSRSRRSAKRVPSSPGPPIGEEEERSLLHRTWVPVAVEPVRVAVPAHDLPFSRREDHARLASPEAVEIHLQRYVLSPRVPHGPLAEVEGDLLEGAPRRGAGPGRHPVGIEGGDDRGVERVSLGLHRGP